MNLFLCAFKNKFDKHCFIVQIGVRYEVVRYEWTEHKMLLVFCKQQRLYCKLYPDSWLHQPCLKVNTTTSEH